MAIVPYYIYICLYSGLFNLLISINLALFNFYGFISIFEII